MGLFRKNLVIGLVALSVSVPGCSLVENGVRTLVIEPLQYPADLDHCQSCSRNHARAASALSAYQCQNAGCYSDDFAWGFKCGFTDYLDNGGTGQPPPLPPRHYWKLKYQTPEGYRAIQEWFSGFQQGVVVAKASGFREQIVVPVMAPPYAAIIKSEIVALPHDGPAGPEAYPVPASPGTPADQQVPDGDLLPAPTPQTKPTTGVLLFDEGGGAGQVQNLNAHTPATGMLLFEEKATVRWQPGNTTPGLAPQNWDLPHDEKPAESPPHPAAQPAQPKSVTGTVWHASKSQTHDMAPPPPSQ
jgi:hypothetical protein